MDVPLLALAGEKFLTPPIKDDLVRSSAGEHLRDFIEFQVNLTGLADDIF